MVLEVIVKISGHAAVLQIKSGSGGWVVHEQPLVTTNYTSLNIDPILESVLANIGHRMIQILGQGCEQVGAGYLTCFHDETPIYFQGNKADSFVSGLILKLVAVFITEGEKRGLWSAVFQYLWVSVLSSAYEFHKQMSRKSYESLVTSIELFFQNCTYFGSNIKFFFSESNLDFDLDLCFASHLLDFAV